MGIRRVGPADDAKPAGKLYPQDKIHQSGHHDHTPAPRQDGDHDRPRSSHIERLQPGQDPTDAINRLYGEGRRYPHKAPHDGPRERTPGYTTPVPTPGEERAHYGQATRAEHVTPAYDEQAPQFPSDKHGATYDNDAHGWVRGKGGESPHPFFDRGLSGSRYRK